MTLKALMLVAILVYAAMLCVIAWRADRNTAHKSGRFRAIQSGLSLSTICSSWAYFGTIGEVRDGSLLYLASGLGPILAVTIGFPMWRRIAQLTKQENVGSIADFLAARYGKSRALGSVVALVCTISALPYLALQLAMLNKVWGFVVGAVPGALSALVLTTALILAAIAFGTRRPSLTQHSRGMVSMVAAEACVKLAGLIGVAGLCLWLGWHDRAIGERLIATVPRPGVRAEGFAFVNALILSTVTAFTLPRQFHFGFVTLENPDDARAARALVPVYFTLWPLAVLIIGTAVRAGLGDGAIEVNLQVLAIPMRFGASSLLLLALLGGLSAGAAMVMAEVTAVSAMVSNELVLPWLAVRDRLHSARRSPAQTILVVRRVTLVAIGLLGWAYAIGARPGIAATHLGFTALGASAQLFPALCGGLFWQRGNFRGAIVGILVGVGVWAGIVITPTFMTVFGVNWGMAVAPRAHFTSSRLFQVATLASLSLNACCFAVVSIATRPRLIDIVQASAFATSERFRREPQAHALPSTLGDLRRLLLQFVGESDAEAALREAWFTGRSRPFEDDAPVDPGIARAAERCLSGVVGASTARNLLAIALSGESEDAADVSRVLDEAAHAVQFGRELLQTILETLDQAVGVVDGQMCLLAWNANYRRLLGVSPGEAYIGRPLGDLLANQASDLDERDVREFLHARLLAVPDRQRFNEELVLASGRALKVIGMPLGSLDYLTTFVDITDLKQAERVLAHANEELDLRVRERTADLTSAVAELDAARQRAERVTSAQQRFVAAASHDLVQPLHAARLFIGTATASIAGDTPLLPLLNRANQSVESAHRLLRALLNLSQLEVGALQPKLAPVDAALLLMSLFEEFCQQAEERGVELVILPTNAWVLTDGDLLRSMLQNLIVNAIRYTPRGRVVVVCRKARGRLRFEVRDNGVGMEASAVPDAFSEFRRLLDGKALADGAGLGLSIVARIANVLDHPVTVRTRPGMGSVFAIDLPMTLPVIGEVRAASDHPVDLKGLRVLCVDDEHDILVGMRGLIELWGGKVTTVASVDAAWTLTPDFDAVIADLRLGAANGLDLLRGFAAHAPIRILISATPPIDLIAQLADENIKVFAKPIEPIALIDALARAAQKESGSVPPLLNSPGVGPVDERTRHQCPEFP